VVYNTWDFFRVEFDGDQRKIIIIIVHVIITVLSRTNNARD